MGSSERDMYSVTVCWAKVDQGVGVPLMLVTVVVEPGAAWARRRARTRWE